MTKYDLFTRPIAFDFLMVPLRRDYTTQELLRKALISVPGR